MEKLSGNDTGIAILKMNRPKVNALGKVFIDTFLSRIDELNSDNSTRVVILTSSFPKVFCAGADLIERKQMNDTESHEFVKKLRHTFNSLEILSQPIIACIDGVAFGGGLELALACDLRIANINAQMGLIETSLAIIPGAGGTQRLPRIIGTQRAKELIYTARKIDAATAYKYGILNHITDDESINMGLNIAREMLNNGPIALKMAKQAINEGIQCSNIMDAMKVEENKYSIVIPTKDRQEAMQAFQEKRKPIFIGE